MGLDKLKKLIGGKEDDEEEIKEEEYYKVSREEYGYENGAQKIPVYDLLLLLSFMEQE